MRGHLLHHLLEQSARKYPGNTAVVFKDDSINYADLDRQSSGLALRLLESGVKKGDRVGIMLNKSIEAITGLFGILKSGAAYVPVDPSAPMERVVYMIERCGIEYLITSSRLLNVLSAGSDAVSRIKTVILVDKDGNPPDPAPKVRYLQWGEVSDALPVACRSVNMSDGCPAYILHTSGSTGRPKGVAISHLNALTFVRMAAEFFDVRSTDRFCNHAPLHFDLSVFDIFVAIRCGATVVLLPEILSTFPAELAAFIAAEKITVWNSVSSLLAMLAAKGRLNRHCFDSMRIVHFSGDVMPVRYLRELVRCMSNASFYNIYGQTEANSSMCYPVREISGDDSWRIPIGRAFPNFDVFALNDVGEVISRPGEEGELYVRSSTVALGYWGDEAMTGEKFVADPLYPFCNKNVYRTGDLVRLDRSGDYVFAGRADHMVKSRGYRIELGEIEAALASHPEVISGIAIPIPDELVGNRIAAIVVPRNGCAPAKEDVVRHCSAKLPKYMMPEIIDFRDSFPLTSSGKVDRKSLAAELSLDPHPCGPAGSAGFRPVSGAGA